MKLGTLTEIQRHLSRYDKRLVSWEEHQICSLSFLSRLKKHLTLKDPIASATKADKARLPLIVKSCFPATNLSLMPRNTEGAA
jgi:hypothetical protein